MPDTPSYKVTQISVDSLLLDAKNPRLSGKDQDLSQDALLRILWREMAVDEIAYSIAANGFFPHEHLFAEKRDSKFLVIEGNRRLAAVKLLLDDRLQQAVGATDLPTISANRRRELATLPVVECRRSDIWQYVGFKHVNGPQAWESFSKAEYIAWVHNDLHVPLERVASHIGDQHSTVKRLYRALMALRQAEEEGAFSRDDRWKRHFSFSHLYTGLDYPGIQKFLGLSKGERSFETPKPIPKARLPNLVEVCDWLFGSKSKNKQPVVKSQNPDLRILDEVITTKNGLAALRQGMPLEVSRKLGRGDEKLFREAMVAAKRSLEEARGKLLTGFDGERDLVHLGKDILTLAESIYTEMSGRRMRSTARRSS